MKKKILGSLCAIGLLSASAWADSLTYAGAVAISGNGFGNDPRLLTIQSHGPSSNVESGCIAPGGGGGLIAGAGACAPGGLAVGGNETSPLGFPKQSAPTLSSLGITNGSQIGILFDGVQPQSGGKNVVNINDLTLKLYNGTTLLYSVSGTFPGLATNPGNGTSDYLFRLDPNAVAAFNAALGGNFTDRIALDSTISFAGQSAGPDSFSLVNLGQVTSPVPEPPSVMLMGTSGLMGIVGWMFARRKRMGAAA